MIVYDGEVMSPILGVNPANATAEEGDVINGKSFYAGANHKRVGNLEAYKVAQALQPNGTVHLLINSIGQNSEQIISAENINAMKSADLKAILENGGEIATDEEYEQAETQFQTLARNIMGV